jgi:NAD(P)-dependent dehydrogenase (short-subunit alcohol dehydrogenase family)
MYLGKYDLAGRTAFITGGGRGIGLAAADALLEAGARVVISDHNPELLDSGRSELAARGREVNTVLLDVTDADAVGRAAQEANDRHGAVDILIANAGIAWRTRRASRWRMRCGARSSMSTSTASTGPAASSAGRCWNADAGRSSPSARCRG